MSKNEPISKKNILREKNPINLPKMDIFSWRMVIFDQSRWFQSFLKKAEKGNFCHFRLFSQSFTIIGFSQKLSVVGISSPIRTLQLLPPFPFFRPPEKRCRFRPPVDINRHLSTTSVMKINQFCEVLLDFLFGTNFFQKLVYFWTFLSFSLLSYIDIYIENSAFHSGPPAIP